MKRYLIVLLCVFYVLHLNAYNNSDGWQSYAENTHTQRSTTRMREAAIKIAKELFVATANGDVNRLKQLMTSDFYKQHYPYSDAKVREMLLSVPYARRQNMKDQILNHSDVSTVINRPGDVITVFLTNSKL